MIRLKVVTPTRQFYDDDVKMCVIRGVEGDLAVMKDTTKLITPLRIGRLKLIFEDGKKLTAALSDGYVTVSDNVCTIVTDEALWPEEIDVEKVNREFNAIMDKMSNTEKLDNIEYEKKCLQKCIVQLEVAKEKQQ